MPASGKISINIFKPGSTNSGSSSSGGRQQGTNSNPTIVDGSFGLLKMLSPLLALYSIDRAMRALGMTSNVLSGYISALGSIWGAIADTLLLPLKPVLDGLLKMSLELLAWLRANWPRLAAGIGDVWSKLGKGDLPGAWQEFSKSPDDQKMATIIATVLGIVVSATIVKKIFDLVGVSWFASKVFSGPGAPGAGKGLLGMGAARFLGGAGLVAGGADSSLSQTFSPKEASILERLINVGALIGGGFLLGGPIGAAVGAGIGLGINTYDVGNRNGMFSSPVTIQQNITNNNNINANEKGIQQAISETERQKAESAWNEILNNYFSSSIGAPG